VGYFIPVIIDPFADLWPAVTYFTNLIHLCIKFAVGNGDISPFIGHNAFLRWKALQSVCFKDTDGRVLFWSESHLSMCGKILIWL
jgi:hypothetical protein